MEDRQGLLSPLTRLENIVGRIFRRLYPEVGTFDRVYYARVKKAYFDGGKVDANGKKKSVDVEVLKGDLSIDPRFEVILDVPVDGIPFGNGGIAFGVPAAGTIVRVGFMTGDPRFPFVLSYTNEGKTVPAGAEDEFRIETPEGVIIQLKGTKINIKTAAYNTDLETFIDKFFIHTHLGNMGAPTSTVEQSVPPLLKAELKTGDL
jgi:hypothetical protein